MKTHAVKASEIQHRWVVVDAANETLGRLASRIAQLLKGKHKPIYSPHLDVGDFVVVINAERIRISGKKAEQKMYYRHSGYPGGLKSVSYRDLMQKRPTKIIEHAVRGMLPHSALGKAMLGKLKVYAGPTHPHEAQINGPLGEKTKS
ncbi:MAG: 50S ribosomal protein L13 [Chloroflexi bacterium]|nr:50S ribosomal protein L13 [Chloroflexota bacterium]